jgi:hypothetical protein
VRNLRSGLNVPHGWVTFEFARCPTFGSGIVASVFESGPSGPALRHRVAVGSSGA